jgi:hypothetical protein
MIPSFSPRSAPLELSGASRSTIVIRSHHRRLASMSFSCSRDQVSRYPRGNFSEALEAVFRLAISFRRSLINHAHIKAWSSEHGRQRNSASGAQSYE